MRSRVLVIDRLSPSLPNPSKRSIPSVGACGMMRIKRRLMPRTTKRRSHARSLDELVTSARKRTLTARKERTLTTRKERTLTARKERTLTARKERTLTARNPLRIDGPPSLPQFNPAPHLAWKGPHLAWNCIPSQLSCYNPPF
jgi:hypothetical protein